MSADQVFFQPDPFASAHLGCSAWSLPTGVLGRFAAEGSSLLLPPGPCFVSTRAPAGEVVVIQRLEELGFRFVEVSLTFFREKGAGPSASVASAWRVREARPEDESRVGAIARDSFARSRFHLDPRIPRERANALKEAWARNFFRGARGDRLIVAEKDGVVGGFLLALASADGRQATIDLVAASEECRGQGVGRVLVDGFAELYRDRQVLLVGTQAPNLGSIRLYESRGFRLHNTQVVLHYSSA